MKRTAVLLLVLGIVSGCKQMDEIIQPRRSTPEERAYNLYMGLILLQMSQPTPATPPPTLYVIDGRHITCSQMNNVVTCN